MKLVTKAKVLTAEAKPYNVDGNQGVSYKIRLNVEGEIFVCKSDEAQVSEFKARIGEEGKAEIEVVSHKENMSLRLVSLGK